MTHNMGTTHEPDHTVRGPSPVIGVLLMVLITLVLVGILGTFVIA